MEQGQLEWRLLDVDDQDRLNEQTWKRKIPGLILPGLLWRRK